MVHTLLMLNTGQAARSSEVLHLCSTYDEMLLSADHLRVELDLTLLLACKCTVTYMVLELQQRMTNIFISNL